MKKNNQPRKDSATVMAYLLVVILITYTIFVPIGGSDCDCDIPEESNIIKTNTVFKPFSKSDILTLQKQGKIEGWTFTVGENSATKYSLNELCGFYLPEEWWINAQFNPCTPRDDLPDIFDWRDVDGMDYTTPIKSQGSCGSCWAFGTVAPLECNIKIKDGIEVDLSEQWLVSCNLDGWSCGGGSWAHDYHMWKTDPFGGTGGVLEQFFPYVASNAPCNGPYPHDYLIEDWAFIGDGHSVPSVDAIKQAIYVYGPVSASVCVNPAFLAYNGGIFNGPSCSVINHAVALVGWDDNQGTNGVWFLRNSWGTNWGEDGYMRIEYGICSIGYSACYVNYQGSPFLKITLPDGTPSILAEGEPTDVRVQIHEINDTYIPGSGKLHYRYDGGAFLNSSMIHVEGDMYNAILPPSSCNDTPEFYFSVEGVNAGIIYSPYNALNATYSSQVGKLISVFSDDFETDLGWTVKNNSFLTDGAWERGIPIGGGDRGDPPSDYDGSGNCFLTDNEDGDSDVDGGITWLTSPPIDITSSTSIDARVDYALWYTNNFGSDPNNDIFRVYVSNNNGESWIFAKAFGPETSAGWEEYSFIISDYSAPTGVMKIRFEASDLDNESIVEAGIDAFRISIFESCFEPDLSCDGELSWADIKPGSTVEGNLTVVNIGEPNSMLDWKISDYPNWGTWTFAPKYGNDLKPEDGIVSVRVYVKAPNEPMENYSGTVKIINKADNSDYCEIPVNLATPVNQNLNNFQFLRFFQRFIHLSIFYDILITLTNL
ncbi:MAG: hypothetical protein JSW06_06745 [Thermoplasmatales archaeon]|nr:MAG: hypothetical protein JSW06_06745 [Thermoplasmatales archaeon]